MGLEIISNLKILRFKILGYPNRAFGFYSPKSKSMCPNPVIQTHWYLIISQLLKSHKEKPLSSLCSQTKD